MCEYPLLDSKYSVVCHGRARLPFTMPLLSTGGTTRSRVIHAHAEMACGLGLLLWALCGLVVFRPAQGQLAGVCATSPDLCSCAMQCVCITDPVLATQVLQSKVVDKLRFPYSFLDPVSPPSTRHMLHGHLAMQLCCHRACGLHHVQGTASCATAPELCCKACSWIFADLNAGHGRMTSVHALLCYRRDPQAFGRVSRPFEEHQTKGINHRLCCCSFSEARTC